VNEPTKIVNGKVSKRILDERYEILNTIGNGRFAKVKRAIDLNSNKEVAVKILKTHKTSLSRKQMLENFYSEIKILTYCRHPNIVRLIDASFDGVMINE